MKLQDTIVWGDLDCIETLRIGTVTKISKDLCWVDGYHKPENGIYQAYCWPIQYKEELIKIIKIRTALKKQYDDSMTLIYELRNEISRRES